MMKRLNKKGVSLAELLAVVVIMGIIAAIAIPLVGNVIETSKKKAVLGDATTLAEAAQTYCTVFDASHEKLDICNKAGGGTYDLSEKGDGTEAQKFATIFQEYVSKDLSKIGDQIFIEYDADTQKFKVQITGFASGQIYSTSNDNSTAGLIDPTDPDLDISTTIIDVA